MIECSLTALICPWEGAHHLHTLWIEAFSSISTLELYSSSPLRIQYHSLQALLNVTELLNIRQTMHLTKGWGGRAEEMKKSVSYSKPNHTIAKSANPSYLRSMIAHKNQSHYLNSSITNFIYSSVLYFLSLQLNQSNPKSTPHSPDLISWLLISPNESNCQHPLLTRTDARILGPIYRTHDAVQYCTKEWASEIKLQVSSIYTYDLNAHWKNKLGRNSSRLNYPAVSISALGLLQWLLLHSINNPSITTVTHFSALSTNIY